MHSPSFLALKLDNPESPQFTQTTSNMVQRKYQGVTLDMSEMRTVQPSELGAFNNLAIHENLLQRGRVKMRRALVAIEDSNT